MDSFFTGDWLSSPDLALSEVVDLLDIVEHLLVIDLEILQQSIIEAKHPAVHYGVLVLGIRLLNSGCLDDVSALLPNTQLDESIVPLGLVLNGVQLLLVEAVDVTNVTEPGVQQAQVLRGHGGLDTTAAVVAAHDDVLDVKVAHGILNDAHNVEVSVDDQVGNVAVDEDLTGAQTGDLLGGDARVAASDP